MKKTYYTPSAEEFVIGLERGFLVGSVTGDDTGIPGLLDPGLDDISWIL